MCFFKKKTINCCWCSQTSLFSNKIQLRIWNVSVEIYCHWQILWVISFWNRQSFLDVKGTCNNEKVFSSIKIKVFITYKTFTTNFKWCWVVKYTFSCFYIVSFQSILNGNENIHKLRQSAVLNFNFLRHLALMLRISKYAKKKYCEKRNFDHFKSV